MTRRLALAGSFCFFALLVSCGPNVQTTNSGVSGTAPAESAQASAALTKAREVLVALVDGPRITGERSCAATTVLAFNTAEELSGKDVTQPIVGAKADSSIWVCEFEVLFDRPARVPPGLTAPPMPTGGVARIARVAILAAVGEYQVSFYEKEPPPLTE